MSTRIIPLALLCLLAAPLSLAAQTKPPVQTVELVPAELAGVVRDTSGNPLPDAEILLPVAGKSARSGRDGRFLIAGVAPGFHEVWLRHIGHVSVPFDWTAEEGKRVEIAVTLRPLPNTLDPVMVYATEGKSLRSTSVVSGIVVDSGGVPIANADLQLIGTSRTTVSANDGSFEFRHVPSGQMTLRARRMGYAPGTLMIELQNDDQRAVTMRIRRLATMLDTVTVTEESGYGRSDQAWEDFGRRERWRNSGGGDAFTIGPQRLREAGGMPLDWLVGPYIGNPPGKNRAPTSLLPNNGGHEAPPPPSPFPADCILENGLTARYIPLSIYAASEIDRLEYYPAAPPEREYTGTVEVRMRLFPQCGPQLNGGHPPYYVLWLKNAR